MDIEQSDFRENSKPLVALIDALVITHPSQKPALLENFQRELGVFFTTQPNPIDHLPTSLAPIFDALTEKLRQSYAKSPSLADLQTEAFLTELILRAKEGLKDASVEARLTNIVKAPATENFEAEVAEGMNLRDPLKRVVSEADLYPLTEIQAVSLKSALDSAQRFYPLEFIDLCDKSHADLGAPTVSGAIKEEEQGFTIELEQSQKSAAFYTEVCASTEPVGSSFCVKNEGALGSLSISDLTELLTQKYLSPPAERQPLKDPAALIDVLQILDRKWEFTGEEGDTHDELEQLTEKIIERAFSLYAQEKKDFQREQLEFLRRQAKDYTPLILEKETEAVATRYNDYISQRPWTISMEAFVSKVSELQEIESIPPSYLIPKFCEKNKTALSQLDVQRELIPLLQARALNIENQKSRLYAIDLLEFIAARIDSQPSENADKKALIDFQEQLHEKIAQHFGVRGTEESGILAQLKADQGTLEEWAAAIRTSPSLPSLELDSERLKALDPLSELIPLLIEIYCNPESPIASYEPLIAFHDVFTDPYFTQSDPFITEALWEMSEAIMANSSDEIRNFINPNRQESTETSGQSPLNQRGFDLRSDRQYLKEIKIQSLKRLPISHTYCADNESDLIYLGPSGSKGFLELIVERYKLQKRATSPPAITDYQQQQDLVHFIDRRLDDLDTQRNLLADPHQIEAVKKELEGLKSQILLNSSMMLSPKSLVDFYIQDPSKQNETLRFLDAEFQAPIDLEKVSRVLEIHEKVVKALTSGPTKESKVALLRFQKSCEGVIARLCKEHEDSLQELLGAAFQAPIDLEKVSRVLEIHEKVVKALTSGPTKESKVALLRFQESCASQIEQFLREHPDLSPQSSRANLPSSVLSLFDFYEKLQSLTKSRDECLSQLEQSYAKEKSPESLQKEKQLFQEFIRSSRERKNHIVDFAIPSQNGLNPLSFLLESPLFKGDLEKDAFAKLKASIEGSGRVYTPELRAFEKEFIIDIQSNSTLAVPSDKIQEILKAPPPGPGEPAEKHVEYLRSVEAALFSVDILGTPSGSHEASHQPESFISFLEDRYLNNPILANPDVLKELITILEARWQLLHETDVTVALGNPYNPCSKIERLVERLIARHLEYSKDDKSFTSELMSCQLQGQLSILLKNFQKDQPSDLTPEHSTKSPLEIATTRLQKSTLVGFEKFFSEANTEALMKMDPVGLKKTLEAYMEVTAGSNSRIYAISLLEFIRKKQINMVFLDEPQEGFGFLKDIANTVAQRAQSKFGQKEEGENREKEPLDFRRTLKILTKDNAAIESLLAKSKTLDMRGIDLVKLSQLDLGILFPLFREKFVKPNQVLSLEEIVDIFKFLENTQKKISKSPFQEGLLKELLDLKSEIADKAPPHILKGLRATLSRYNGDGEYDYSVSFINRCIEEKEECERLKGRSIQELIGTSTCFESMVYADSELFHTMMIEAIKPEPPSSIFVRIWRGVFGPPPTIKSEEEFFKVLSLLGKRHSALQGDGLKERVDVKKDLEILDIIYATVLKNTGSKTLDRLPEGGAPKSLGATLSHFSEKISEYDGWGYNQDTHKDKERGGEEHKKQTKATELRAGAELQHPPSPRSVAEIDERGSARDLPKHGGSLCDGSVGSLAGLIDNHKPFQKR